MNDINNINDMKNEVKRTTNKVKHMAKEVVGDAKDNFQGAMNVMESKIEDTKDNLKSTMNTIGSKINDAVDMFEPKKLAHDIKKEMK